MQKHIGVVAVMQIRICTPVHEVGVLCSASSASHIKHHTVESFVAKVCSYEVSKKYPVLPVAQRFYLDFLSIMRIQLLLHL